MVGESAVKADLKRKLKKAEERIEEFSQRCRKLEAEVEAYREVIQKLKRVLGYDA